MYDILIRQGLVKDPAQGISQVEDIAIQNGKIARIAPDLSNEKAGQVLNAQGMLVTPGLTDFHIHVFTGGCSFAVPAEIPAFTSGVTRVVDGGTAGHTCFDTFWREDILKSRVDIRAMLNVCTAGQLDVGYLEDFDPKLMRVDKIAELCERHKGTIVALKIRQSREIVKELGLEPLKKCVEIGNLVGLPVVVHATDSPGEIKDTLDILRPGDVFCHCFHQRGKTILEDGHVLPEVREAQKRGILFDCAHGSMNFSLKVAGTAVGESFYPDIISSDLSQLSLMKAPAYSFAHILSELMSVGMSFDDVLKRCTVAPAKLMQEEPNCYFAEGKPADIAVFRLDDVHVPIRDVYGNSAELSKQLTPMLTVRKGVIVYRQCGYYNEM